MSTHAFDRTHGSLYDRGKADSYYDRPRAPHYYEAATYTSPKIDAATSEEIAEYHAGYDHNESTGDKKNWGYESW